MSSNIITTDDTKSFDLQIKEILYKPLPDGKTLPPRESSNPTSPTTEKINISEALVKVNEYLDITQRNLKFVVSPVTGETIIHVIDTGTNEIIRKIPSDEIMNLAQALQDFDGGILNQTV